MKNMITSGASVIDITKLAMAQGMTSLVKDARDKVGRGLTTVDEVLRVLGPQVIG